MPHKINSFIFNLCFRRPEPSVTNSEFISTKIFTPEIKANAKFKILKYKKEY